MYRSSFYNLQVKEGEDTLLFNGASGALVRLPAFLSDQLAPFLGPPRSCKAGEGYSNWNPPAFSLDDLPKKSQRYAQTLIECGIFVADHIDERAGLKKRYEKNRSNAPLFVTMTTTLNCNMRCYYCYQKDGLLDSMSEATCDAAIEWVKDRVCQRGHDVLHVDWYGGEPMLNQAVIERFSSVMTRWCDEKGVIYRGSMICNGTSWPEDARGFLARTRIESIQFSLDGPKRHHDKRRGKIRTDSPGRDASFDEVMNTVERVLGAAKVYLRINVDPYIGRDALEMLDYCEARGWLQEGTRFYPYLAVINAMTEHCGFIGKSARFQDFNEEFDRIQQEFYRRLASLCGGSSLEVVQYYPNRVSLNCAAVSHNSVVFGPDGLMYKCGLDVGDKHRAHDGVMGTAPGTDQLDPKRWDRYDPFVHARCSECQYLPVCMGGCPKAQIEQDQKQISLQSEFWENNFARIVREYSNSVRAGA